MPVSNANKRSIRSKSTAMVAVVALFSMGTPCLSNGQSEPIELRPVVRTNSTPRPDPDIDLRPVNRSSSNVISGANLRTSTSVEIPEAFSRRIFEAQVELARLGISAGSIDGLFGSQTKSAIRAFQQKEDLRATGLLDEATMTGLTSSEPALVSYTIREEDLARLLPLGATWLAKSEQPRLDYETILELVAEKSHAHPRLIQQLNPGIDWGNIAAGISINVPNAELPTNSIKAGAVKIKLAERMLEAFDKEGTLLAHFPCSIAQRVDKRPVGELRVDVIAPNPNYTFNPEVFPESAEARELGRKLIIQPGPNNPVGIVWIGLDRPGYGIHGTPRPEDVGRTESHGCFRLANWNAEFLMRLVTIGTPVIVED